MHECKIRAFQTTFCSHSRDARIVYMTPHSEVLGNGNAQMTPHIAVLGNGNTQISAPRARDVFGLLVLVVSSYNCCLARRKGVAFIRTPSLVMPSLTHRPAAAKAKKQVRFNTTVRGIFFETSTDNHERIWYSPEEFRVLQQTLQTDIELIHSLRRKLMNRPHVPLSAA